MGGYSKVALSVGGLLLIADSLYAISSAEKDDTKNILNIVKTGVGVLMITM